VVHSLVSNLAQPISCFSRHLHVAGLVDAVDIAEASRDREELADGAQLLVDGPDVLGLGVKGRIVHALFLQS
jgi:hypothetical protein